MDRSLPLWERARLLFHLRICDACANFNRQVQFLRRALKSLLGER